MSFIALPRLESSSFPFTCALTEKSPCANACATPIIFSMGRVIPFDAKYAGKTMIIDTASIDTISADIMPCMADVISFKGLIMNTAPFISSLLKPIPKAGAPTITLLSSDTDTSATFSPLNTVSIYGFISS